MHTSLFFKVFPPPKFLAPSHAGINISDDAIRLISFVRHGRRLRIARHASIELPPGLVDGGDIKDEKKVIELLSAAAREHGVSYAKVSIPEEKAYLFQTDVPPGRISDIAKNIEFKLEENVPLSSADCVFYFNLVRQMSGTSFKASVSVVPKAYIEKQMNLLKSAGITPLAFEVAPKSIARAIIPMDDIATRLIVHIMKRKTGIYIISGRAVCFSSTLVRPLDASVADYVKPLAIEIERVFSYWSSRGTPRPPIVETLIVGRDAPVCEAELSRSIRDLVPVRVADVWRNTFNVSDYIPPIPQADALDYPVCIGLALI